VVCSAEVKTVDESGDECAPESGAVRALILSIAYKADEVYLISGGADSDGIMIDDGEIKELTDATDDACARLEADATASGDAAKYINGLALAADEEKEKEIAMLEEGLKRSMRLGIAVSAIAFILLIGVIALAIFR
jgi:hypothetical protein